MSRKYTLYSIFLIGLLFIVPGYSQSVMGTQYPLGIPQQSGTGLSLSMGGAGIGVSNDILGMTENPANLGAIRRAVFSIHSSLDFTNIKEKGEESNHLTFNPHIFSFCFPIQKFGSLGFSVAQTGNSDAKYMISDNLEGGTELGKLSLIKKGNSIVWQAGWGYDIKRVVKIGLAYQRMYYNPKTIIERTSEDDTYINSLVDSTAISFIGNGISAGIQVPIKKLTLGMSGQYIFENDAHFSQFEKYRASDKADSLKEEKYYTMRPAPSIGFGASYQISPEWLCAADFESVIWSKFISKPEEPVDNAYSFSAGAQFIPAPNLLAPKYYEIMQYRAGVRYNQLPVSTASEFGLSLGVGLPLREGGGLFDVFFEYGQRWDSGHQDTKEEFFKIQFGINAGRKWYQSTDTNY